MSWVDHQLMNSELQLLKERHQNKSYLIKKEMAVELRISQRTLDRRIKAGVDIPRYKEAKTGRIIFPLSAIAEYYASNLVRTHF
ncbi:hypothetical protein PF327_09940 [Sulfurovum sp. XTW-4]|uniref:Helix-turn-helix domain-containing protein n=1 Tax=Sulfurovum xiamenensis TaxID=3019066 RepID=A0ABT7QTX1_9BACT|nr:hypothetical protein [Sulfurovum xiamenensis]MDM5264516.1 hypothetical protein [Sulfurovum xiamenensis]